jgi:protein-S-isoprenylcysteine O-methyltransferase Ste14
MGTIILITVLLHVLSSYWQLRKQPKGRARLADPDAGTIIRVVIALKKYAIMPAITISLVLYSFFPSREIWFTLDPLKILWIQIAGIVLMMTSILFKVWAYATLGKNWAATPTIYEDHSLICEGPYALVRHPVYTSNIVMHLGVFIATGSSTLLALGICYFATDVVRANVEERRLAIRFGEVYAQYQATVGKFVPRAVTLSFAGIIVACNLVGIADQLLFTCSGNSLAAKVLACLLG